MREREWGIMAHSLIYFWRRICGWLVPRVWWARCCFTDSQSCLQVPSWCSQNLYPPKQQPNTHTKQKYHIQNSTVHKTHAHSPPFTSRQLPRLQSQGSGSRQTHTGGSTVRPKTPQRSTAAPGSCSATTPARLKARATSLMPSLPYWHLAERQPGAHSGSQRQQGLHASQKWPLYFCPLGKEDSSVSFRTSPSTLCPESYKLHTLY